MTTTPSTARTTGRIMCERLESEVRIDRRDSAHHDAKGRLIGGRCRISTDTYVAKPAGAMSGYVHHEPGSVVYSYEPHALRDGKAFGALQARMDYATAAERDAAVEKYFAGMAKRAAKAAAKIAAK